MIHCNTGRWLCTRLYFKDNAGESNPAWTALLAWRFTER